MTNDPNDNYWRELSWRRKLTGAEEAQLRTWLAAHPEAQADWESEAGLSAALGGLPDVPVPSNFTARVLQAVEREAGAAGRLGERPWPFQRRLRWLPKVAFAALMLGAGLLSYHQYHAVRLREYGNSLAAISAVSSLPGPDILKDFDAIRASDPTPLPDEQLLAALE